MNPILKFMLCLSATTASGIVSGQQMTVRHLGQGKSIVAVDKPTRYLVVPVEESAPETRILLFTEGHVRQRINVRLAQQRIDYYVPIDLRTYSQEYVALNIHMPVADAIHRNASEAVCWDKMFLSDEFDDTNTEKYRPAYHFTPRYGWMNDPNGMICIDGEYHLFYQYNPYGSMWGNMNWGHAVSKDMLHWEHLPVAIAPDDWGVVFSGCSVVDTENVAGLGKGALLAFYTATSTFSHDGERQTQCIAYSTDNGRTFEKYARNPVLTSTETDFRDPKVFRHAPSGRWIMVVAVDDRMEFFSSENLLDWRYESAFGAEFGAHGGVWECPDLLELPVEGSADKRWVLLCNINPGGPAGGSATQYFVGDFDGSTFTCADAPERVKWLDTGKDHYAAVSWGDLPDGRCVAIGWMSNWEYANDVPTRQFRGANTLPRSLHLYAVGDDYRLRSVPVAETEALRETGTLRRKTTRISRPCVLKNISAGSDTYELLVDLRNRSAKSITLRLSNEAGERLDIEFSPDEKLVSMDRSACGDTSFNGAFPTVTTASTDGGEELTLRLFIDRGSAELFGDDGRIAMTNLIYPRQPLTTLSIIPDGGVCTLVSAVCYPLKKLY